MEKLSKDEVKKRALAVMQYLHETCENNNIYYVLSSGSCLGAVRHKGFIPWDDDIDVFVPRAHYDRLIDALNSGEGQFRALTYTNCEGYYYPFCKLVDTQTFSQQDGYNPIQSMGLFVDIFPVDGLPSDVKVREKHIRKARRYARLILIKNAVHTPNPIRNIAKRMVGSFFKSESLCRKVNDLALKYSEQTSEYAMDIVWGTKPFLNEYIKERILVPFEDHHFYIPKNYDGYLKTIYGDYMKLPPIEKRTSHDLEVYLR